MRNAIQYQYHISVLPRQTTMMMKTLKPLHRTARSSGQHVKKGIFIVQGDWNAKIGEDTAAHWSSTCGKYCNQITNDRGLRLLEYAGCNSLAVANSFGPHKMSRMWTWHSLNGLHHSQIDYLLVKKHFMNTINIHKAHHFPGADIRSDHDLVMMTLHLHLHKTRKAQFN